MSKDGICEWCGQKVERDIQPPHNHPINTPQTSPIQDNELDNILDGIYGGDSVIEKHIPRPEAKARIKAYTESQLTAFKEALEAEATVLTLAGLYKSVPMVSMKAIESVFKQRRSK